MGARSIARAADRRAAKRRIGWPASHMLGAMPHTLYVIHGSHPCVTAERALQLKGQPYRIHEMAPALHVPEQWLRFRAHDACRRSCSAAARRSSARARSCTGSTSSCPSRRCCPRTPSCARRVVEAERWGDEVLQPVPRRLVWTGVCARPGRDRRATRRARDCPLPGFVRRLAAPRIARVARWRNRGGEAQARKDLAALPGAARPGRRAGSPRA